jgi:hypothetical protein
MYARHEIKKIKAFGRESDCIMWRKMSKGVFNRHKKGFLSLLIGVCIAGFLLAACGTTGGVTSATNGSAAVPSVNQHQEGVASGSSSGQQPGGAAQYGPQYLEKTLQVSMAVQDTRQSATFIQQWLTSADPQATSDGVDYEQISTNQYNVTLTFLVDTAHYTQFEDYLRDYAGQRGHSLLSLQETVQDVTNDYVDTQASLSNLRAEEQRLLTLMNQAQDLSDTLNVEQQLTQVDGQINDIEAHLNALKGETTFYTVNINLQPVGTVPPPTSPPPAWSIVSIWQSAWGAVIGIWQVLMSMIVWLAAFSIYIIPLAVIVWLVRKRVWRGSPRVFPAGSTVNTGGSEPK